VTIIWEQDVHFDKMPTMSRVSRHLAVYLQEHTGYEASSSQSGLQTGWHIVNNAYAVSRVSSAFSGILTSLK
jgi:hypothetical protein